MELTNFRISESGNTVRASIDVDGRELYFLFAGVDHLQSAGDLMLLACLIAAMRDGRSLTIRDDRCLVSGRLLENLTEFQNIFSQWYGDLTSVDLVAPRTTRTSDSGGCGCFFSGGVDSFYSFFRHRDAITHLVFCNGFDIRLDEKERFEQALSFNREFADHYQKTMFVVETNIRDAIPDYDALKSHGAVLAGISLALGFKTQYFPASHSYGELFPWGSHPLTDPLLSNEATTIIHDGAARRTAKLAFIGEHKEALEMLRVCNSEDAYNCGVCEKCLRTIVALHLLSLESLVLPPLSSSLRHLKRLKIYSDNEYIFWHDNLLLAKHAGDPELVTIITKICDNYLLRQQLKSLYTLLIGRRRSI